MKPVRIQRKRTKGWKMPENTVYVGRPSKWGNPFKIVGDMIYGDAGHRRKIFDKWVYIQTDNNDFINWRGLPAKIVLALYFNWLVGNDKNYIKPVPFENLNELKGKNLACWCKEGDPCHADILLKLANGD